MPQVLQRHLQEAGKIRIGAQVPIKSGKNAGKPRPEKLTSFRLTSNSQSALSLVAKRYGGEVQRWTIRDEWKTLPQMRTPDHQWELFTETDTLDILVRADGLMDTSFERWDGAFCALRCTGEIIIKDGQGRGADNLTGRPCVCPSNPQERKDLAKKTKGQGACTEVSRICVMLEGLALGQWRLDTRGFYGPAEIRGLQEILHGCEVGSMILKATMRLEQRTDNKLTEGDKETLHYPVVVIEPRQSIDVLLLEGERRRLSRPQRPIEGQKSLAETCIDLYGVPPVYETHARLTAGTSTATLDAAEDYVPRIEAAVLKAQRDLPGFWAWACKRCKKAKQADLTVDDYALLLEIALGTATKQESQDIQVQVEDVSHLTESSQPGDISHAWAILQHHATDPGLPQDVRTQIAAALSPLAPATEAEVEKLASSIVDYLDAPTEESETL